MLQQFAANGFDVKIHRASGLPALGRRDVDVFLQAELAGDGTYKCRLVYGFPTGPARCTLHFEADYVGLGVVATVLTEMPDVTPMHMQKTVQKHGRKLALDNPVPLQSG